MCPIELHSVTPDAVISGTDVRALAEALGAVTWAWGRQAGVGRVRPHTVDPCRLDEGGAVQSTPGSFLPAAID